MTTDDVLGSGIQLNELLDISSGDTFTSLGDAILDDIPEVDINGFKMHAHLILLVGEVHPIEGRTPNKNLDHTYGQHNSNSRRLNQNHTEQGSTLL